MHPKDLSEKWTRKCRNCMAINELKINQMKKYN